MEDSIKTELIQKYGKLEFNTPMIQRKLADYWLRVKDKFEKNIKITDNTLCNILTIHSKDNRTFEVIVDLDDNIIYTTEVNGENHGLK